jgi:hypothetical protein
MSPTVFEDNASIRDDENLFRRIHLLHLVPDEDTGLARISSGAFKQREMSVNLESALRQSGKGLEACLIGYPRQRLCSIKAGAARNCSQAICHDPLPDDLSHGVVYGIKNGRIPDRLRARAEWALPPVPPPYAEIEEEKRSAGLPA